MADVKQAVDFVLRQEDSQLKGVITENLGDRGGRTRFGLSERWHPELVKSGFFTTMGRDDSFALAETTYTNVYSGPLMLGKIYGQAVATALLSFSVVEGNHQAITLLQRALVSLGAQLTVDGEMGTGTVTWMNATREDSLLPRLVAFQKAYFAQLARNIPSQSKWVTGWDNRADAFLALLAKPVSPAPTLPAVAAVAPPAAPPIPSSDQPPTQAVMQKEPDSMQESPTIVETGL